MHPFTAQQLAAEHVKELLAEADDARRARQARRARRSRESRQRTPLGQAGLEWPSMTNAVTTFPAAGRPGPSADGDQRREPVLADRGHPRA